MKKRSENMKSALIYGALILLCAWIGQPTATGYLHAGDIVVLMAALFLPTPYALGTAAIAATLGDLINGYLILAPVTLVIKICMVLVVKGLMRTSFGQKHPELAVFPAAFIPAAGYYLYMLVYQLLMGNGAASFLLATGTLRKDLIQAAASFVLLVFFYDMYLGIRSARAAIAAEKAKEEAENQPETDDSQMLE